MKEIFKFTKYIIITTYISIVCIFTLLIINTLVGLYVYYFWEYTIYGNLKMKTIYNTPGTKAILKLGDDIVGYVGALDVWHVNYPYLYGSMVNDDSWLVGKRLNKKVIYYNNSSSSKSEYFGFVYNCKNSKLKIFSDINEYESYIIMNNIKIKGFDNGENMMALRNGERVYMPECKK